MFSRPFLTETGTRASLRLRRQQQRVVNVTTFRRTQSRARSKKWNALECVHPKFVGTIRNHGVPPGEVFRKHGIL